MVYWGVATVACYSCLQPQVRAGCWVGTKDEWAILKWHDRPPPGYYPSPDTPSQVLINKIHNELSYFFFQKWIFVDLFSLQEGGICTPGMPEGVDRKTTKVTNKSTHRHGWEMKWNSGSLLVPKLCQDPAMLNKAVIRSVYRGPILNNIIPRLAGITYLTLIDANTGYHNLKLEEISLYLRTVSCPFGRDT